MAKLGTNLRGIWRRDSKGQGSTFIRMYAMREDGAVVVCTIWENGDGIRRTGWALSLRSPITARMRHELQEARLQAHERNVESALKERGYERVTTTRV